VALDSVVTDLALFSADLAPEAIEAMAALSANDPRRAGEHIEAAFQLLGRLGMPPKLQKQTSILGKDLAAGFDLFTDPDNAERFFIPRRWMDTMSGRMGALVKSGDTFAALAADPLEQSLGRIFTAALAQWNRGLLAGSYFGPRVSYFTTILAGNLGNVYAEMGAAEAGAFAARSAYDLTDGALRHIPFFGERLHAESLGRLEKGLPSAMGVFLSPSVSKFYDPQRAKSSELLYPAGGGQPITYGELRKQAIKYGILTSFIGQSGMQDAARRAMETSKWKWFTGSARRAHSEWTHAWSDMADHIEQRQRVGLYMNLVVNKGMDPKKAAAQVRDALYDWSHPMSRMETDYFKRIFMFYTFQRKVAGQTLRHMFYPRLDVNAPMTRTIRLTRAHRGAMAMSDQYWEDNYPPDPYDYPWWVKDVGQRTYGGKRPLTADQVAYWKKRGKRATHRVFSVPAPSTFETFNQLRVL